MLKRKRNLVIKISALTLCTSLLPSTMAFSGENIVQEKVTDGVQTTSAEVNVINESETTTDLKNITNTNQTTEDAVNVESDSKIQIVNTEEESDNESDYDFDVSTGTIKKYNGKDTDIIIPKTINGVEVRNIGDHLFCDCKDLKKVYIPDGVTSIGTYAFNGCENLTSITISDSVTNIGDDVFGGCYKLKNIEVMGNNPNYCSVDGILFNKSKTKIVRYPEAKEDKSYVVPNSVNEIGDYAFSYSSNLENITMSDSVTNIGGSAFAYDVNLASITLSNKLTNISMCMFLDCKNLKSIEIPDSVTNIGFSAFVNCDGLKSMTIPDSVSRDIGWDFIKCLKENDATVYVNSDEVKQYLIDNGILKNKIILNGKTIDQSNESDYDFDASTGTITEYKGSRYDTDVVIPSTINGVKVKSIKGNAFSNRGSYIKSITLPDGITSIEDGAFKGLSLTSITIPKGITSIGNQLFKDCDKLESITIPDSVTSIGDESFENCKSLKNITIPSSVTQIGSETFWGCSSLTKLVIPDSVTTMEDISFVDCVNLTSITLPKNVKGIQSVFNHNCGVTSMDIPECVTDIGSYSFYECTNLTNVTIPKGIKHIGEWAFKDCRSLKSIVIPDGTEFIGNQAFNGCYNLTSVTVPSSVTKIIMGAFFQCDNATFYVEDEETRDRLICAGVDKNKIILKSDSEKDTQNKDTTSTDDVSKQDETSNDKQTTDESKQYESTEIEPDSSAFDFDVSTGTIKKYTGKDTNIKIPKTINGVEVRNIGDHLFFDNTNLTKVDIPDGVTSIGTYAFYGCSNLTNITIPNSVTDIGDDVFGGCYKLKNIKVMDDNQNYSSVDGILFNKLKTKIIRYPEAKENRSYVVPDSVNEIIDSAFSSCSNLENITMTDSVTNIGGSAFAYNTNLTNITLSNKLTSINTCTFLDCKNLKSIKIPDSVTNIGLYAFENCNGLKSMTIPDSVSRENGWDFTTCLRESVATVYVNSDEAKQYLIDSGVLKNKIILNGKPLDLSNESNYKFDENTGTITEYIGSSYDTDVVIPETINGVTIKSIKDNAFSKRGYYVKSIKIPNSVTKIEKDAFVHCNNAIFYVESEETKDCLIYSGIDKNKIVLKNNATSTDESTKNAKMPSAKIIGDMSVGNTLTAKLVNDDGSEVDETSSDISYKWYTIVEKAGIITLVGQGKTYNLGNDDLYKHIQLVITCNGKTYYQLTGAVKKKVNEGQSSTSSEKASNISSRSTSSSSSGSSLNSSTNANNDNNLTSTSSTNSNNNIGDQSTSNSNDNVPALTENAKIEKSQDGTIKLVNSEGKAITGWKQVNGDWYFADSIGAIQKGWQKVNDTWYLLKENGAMAIGWQQVKGTWYLLKDNGSMATGWQKVNDKWYYLYSDGSMASDTTIDGYKVDASGAWV